MQKESKSQQCILIFIKITVMAADLDIHLHQYAIDLKLRQCMHVSSRSFIRSLTAGKVCMNVYVQMDDREAARALSILTSL